MSGRKSQPASMNRRPFFSISNCFRAIGCRWLSFSRTRDSNGCAVDDATYRLRTLMSHETRVAFTFYGARYFRCSRTPFNLKVLRYRLPVSTIGCAQDRLREATILSAIAQSSVGDGTSLRFREPLRTPRILFHRRWGLRNPLTADRGFHEEASSN